MGSKLTVPSGKGDQHNVVIIYKKQKKQLMTVYYTYTTIFPTNLQIH